MIKADLMNKEGKKIGEEKLEPRIFEVDPEASLIQQAIVTQLANRRQVLAHTKTRSEVRGGGRKPWRQKGTGRARHGSIRSPLWRGGGVTFGPRKNRNFSRKINKKARQKALFMVLTDKARNKNIILIDNLKLEKPKTKEFAGIIKNFPLEKTFLTILPASDLAVIRASNNLKKTKCIRADSLNVYDVVRYEKIFMPKESLAVLKKTYLK